MGSYKINPNSSKKKTSKDFTSDDKRKLFAYLKRYEDEPILQAMQKFNCSATTIAILEMQRNESN